MKNMMKKECELLWATEKYFVLSKSQNCYREIRAYLKNEEVLISKVKFLIGKASALPENRGEVINALLHIWGYFRKEVKKEEGKAFSLLIEEYRKERIEKESVIAYIRELLKQYPNPYLQKSTFLFPERRTLL